MCPADTTPDPRDMLRAPDVPEFAQPEAGHEGGDAPPSPVTEPPRLPETVDVSDRPPLPEHPTLTAADIEDEDVDPVGAPANPPLSERLASDSALQRG